MKHEAWQAVAQWMRDEGVASIQCDAAGNLLALSLGERPLSPSSDDNSATTLTADELERRERTERKRVALAASGGLRRRLDENAG